MINYNGNYCVSAFFDVTRHCVHVYGGRTLSYGGLSMFSQCQEIHNPESEGKILRNASVISSRSHTDSYFSKHSMKRGRSVMGES